MLEFTGHVFIRTINLSSYSITDLSLSRVLSGVHPQISKGPMFVSPLFGRQMDVENTTPKRCGILIIARLSQCVWTKTPRGTVDQELQLLTTLRMVKILLCCRPEALA